MNQTTSTSISTTGMKTTMTMTTDDDDNGSGDWGARDGVGADWEGGSNACVGSGKIAVGEVEEGEIPATQSFEQTPKLVPQLCMHRFQY